MKKLYGATLMLLALVCSLFSYNVEVRIHTASTGSGSATWSTEVQGALWDRYTYGETTEGDNDNISVPVSNTADTYGFEFHGNQDGAQEGIKWAYLNAAVYKISVETAPTYTKYFYLDMRFPDQDVSGAGDFDIFFDFDDNNHFLLYDTSGGDTIDVGNGELVTLWEIHDLSACDQSDLDAVSSFEIQYKWHNDHRPYIWFNKRESGDHEVWRKMGRFGTWVKKQDSSTKFYFKDWEIMSGGDTWYYKVLTTNHGSSEISLSGSMSKPIIQRGENLKDLLDIVAHPNPFNPDTQIEYSVLDDGDVDIEIYDISGRLVESLVSEFRSAGVYSIMWNASGMNSGVYFCTIRSSGKIMRHKLLLLK